MGYKFPDGPLVSEKSITNQSMCKNHQSSSPVQRLYLPIVLLVLSFILAIWNVLPKSGHIYS